MGIKVKLEQAINGEGTIPGIDAGFKPNDAFKNYDIYKALANAYRLVWNVDFSQLYEEIFNKLFPGATFSKDGGWQIEEDPLEYWSCAEIDKYLADKSKEAQVKFVKQVQEKVKKEEQQKKQEM